MGFQKTILKLKRTPSSTTEIKLSILESLITRALLLDKATSLELDVFTDEEIANLETEVASFIESNKSVLEMQITQENEALELTMTEDELCKRSAASI